MCILCRAVSGIQCLLLVVLLSVIHAATKSLPSRDVIVTNSDYNKTNEIVYNSDYNKTTSSDKIRAKIRQRRFFQNRHDERLHKVCYPGSAFSEVISVHHNHYEDRIWHWRCRGVTNNPQHCNWARDVNDYDQPINFNCPANQFLAGVESYHHNFFEDRRWSFYCCAGGTLSGCYRTGYLNSFDGDLHYQVPNGKVIAGVHSYHHNFFE